MAFPAPKSTPGAPTGKKPNAFAFFKKKGKKGKKGAMPGGSSTPPPAKGNPFAKK